MRTSGFGQYQDGTQEPQPLVLSLPIVFHVSFALLVSVNETGDVISNH